MLLSFILLAAAQPDPPKPKAEPQPDPAGNDIVVIGERQPRSLRDTAASIAVFGARDIDNQPAADRLESLLPLVPNIQLGSGGEAPTIRGQDSTGVVRDLPAFLGGTRPRTTLQVDGRPADYFELIFGLSSLWDVAQVELFRSPQTITQGRNAIAGAIFIKTADPTFDWRAGGRAIASTGGRRQLSAMASGPLVADDLAFRLSVDWGRDRTASDIAHSMIGANPDIDKQSLIRLKLLARPADWLRLETGLTHSAAQMPQLEGIRAPFRKRRDPLATYGIFGSMIDAVTSEIAIDPSPSVNATTTLTATRSRFERFAPAGLGQAKVRKRVLTGEQVVRWKVSDRLRLLGGLHLLSEGIGQHIDISQLRGIGDFNDKQSSTGLFGEAEWKLLPALMVSAALRYQRDRQSRDGAIVGRGSSANIDYRGRFSAWMPKFSLSWSPSDRWTIGGFTQKAYNPGGSTLLLNGVTDTFEAETLWDHELFVRGSSADRTVSGSLNLFVQQFRNAQRPQTQFVETPNGAPIPISALANAPRARSRGLEAELQWRANAQWRFKAGLGLLDTRITRTLEASDPLAGKQFQRAPHVSASASIEWRPTPRLAVSLQGRGNSGYYSDDTNLAARRIGRGALFDAKASYDIGRARVSTYVRNLTDRFQLTYLLTPTLATAADPREFGIEIGARF